MSDLVKRLRELYDSKRLHIDYAGMSDSHNVYRIQAKQRDMTFIMEAAYAIERMEKACEIYRCERDRQAAIVESLISRLSHIHVLIQPDHIKLPDGRTMEFAPRPELLMECWRGLSKAIREIPDDLESPNKENVDRLERMEKVVEAARAVIERWDTPAWKDTEPTAHVINRMRESIANLDKPTDSFNDLLPCHCFNDLDRKLCRDKHKCIGPAEALNLDKLP